jgi:hypothetical protein
METFRYHSNELKKTPNGVRSNVVTVKNGKGKKNTIIYNNSGKVVENISKKLTISEIKNIKNAKFMPGLFTAMRKRTRKLKR